MTAPAAIPAASAPAAEAPPFSHTGAYRTRRFLNWFPLGLAYAFLYMGRYNLNVAKSSLGDLMTKEDFGFIFLVGTWVYGTSFLLNGPITDKLGGRKSMLISVAGAAVANLAMGLFLVQMLTGADPGRVDLRTWMSVLYGVNMYFQSFGAVAIVKVNASWFHVRERGGFSGIFGTMISSGIFLAYTVNRWILDAVKPVDSADLQPTWVVFFVPAALLAGIFVVELFILRDRPSEAGHTDFDVGDGDSSRSEEGVSVWGIMRRIFTNPIILTIAIIEFCTGVVRQGVMQWFPFYIEEVWVLPAKHALVRGDVTATTMIVSALMIAAGIAIIVAAVKIESVRGWRRTLASFGVMTALVPFVGWGWGGLLFAAGVIGGNVAGYVSDLFFQSRRAPAAGGLYALLTACAVIMIFSLGGTTTEVGWIDAKKETTLQKGDTITAVAGVTAIATWNDVAKAVKCVPAVCVAPKRLGDKAPPSFWDPKTCTCSTRLTANPPDFVPSTGTFPVTVVRAGETMELAIADPKAKLSAGDARKLSAGPKLTVSPWLLGALGFVMSLCVIGTHGLLSGTATMDFGGRKGAATAVGIIDGFVYLGSGVQALALGTLTTKDWSYWPMFLVPFSLAGFLLCLPIWNSKPRKGGGGH